jgi:hypothetical protein
MELAEAPTGHLAHSERTLGAITFARTTGGACRVAVAHSKDTDKAAISSNHGKTISHGHHLHHTVIHFWPQVLISIWEVDWRGEGSMRSDPSVRAAFFFFFFFVASGGGVGTVFRNHNTMALVICGAEKAARVVPVDSIEARKVSGLVEVKLAPNRAALD